MHAPRERAPFSRFSSLSDDAVLPTPISADHKKKAVLAQERTTETPRLGAGAACLLPRKHLEDEGVITNAMVVLCGMQFPDYHQPLKNETGLIQIGFA